MSTRVAAYHARPLALRPRDLPASGIAKAQRLCATVRVPAQGCADDWFVQGLFVHCGIFGRRQWHNRFVECISPGSDTFRCCNISMLPLLLPDFFALCTIVQQQKMTMRCSRPAPASETRQGVYSPPECTPCPIGSYKDSVGTAPCLPCPLHQFINRTGATECPSNDNLADCTSEECLFQARLRPS